MRRFLKAASWTVMLAWLADLEWRSRRQWAATAGIRSEQRTQRETMTQHKAQPHAAYLIGQLPSIDPSTPDGRSPASAFDTGLGVYRGLHLLPLPDPQDIVRPTSA